MSTAQIIDGMDPRSGRSLRVTVVGERIAQIEERAEICEFLLAPGLIDLQVNGSGGLDLNAEDVSAEIVMALTERMLQQGVTSFVPTLISAREDKICHGLDVIAQARRLSPRAAACIPYVHVEGPHLSPRDGYRGAHDAAFIRPPSIAEFDRWCPAADCLVGMVTLSPHDAQAPAYIAHLVQHGVRVALGHTDASAEQIHRAVEAGARLSTHLGNGLAAELPRHRNPLWAQLADDRLTATVIADGHHLPAEFLQVVVRSKGVGNVVLISDSVALAGMAPGDYVTPVGGLVTLHADGRLCVAGTELLAGSTASLSQCVADMMRLTGLSLAEVLPMATSQPGRFVYGRGAMRVGARADLLRFRWKAGMEIDAVWLRGERVYARAGE
ncbi:MAG: amidohydrolase family protein [Acidobacteriota bacterium]|nr:amidohydrolase family protein [Acidobacteriota bacterium]